MLKLILPEEKILAIFSRGACWNIKKSPSPYDIQGIKKAFAYERFADYKRDCEDMRNGKNLPSGHVPNTYLWLIYNEKFIGLYDIRHSLTEYLKNLRRAYSLFQQSPRLGKRGFCSARIEIVL